MKKKVVINTSTIRAGGAIQVAINVISQSFKEDDFDVYYVTNELLNSFVTTDKSKTLVVSEFPSSIFAFKTKKLIRDFVESIKADIVYSVGAPSYIKFNCKEVLRLTNPWLLEDKILAYEKLSLINRIKTRLEVKIKKLYLRNVDYFITQTLDAKNKIVTNLKKKSENVFVIENIYSYNFQRFIDAKFERDYQDIKRIICVSANYPHKNIELFAEIAKLMKRKGIVDYKFLLTIPKDDWQQSNVYKLIVKYDVKDYFENLGKLNLEELTIVYEQSHIFFLPTLLEVFSVSFLEAMIFELPIITTDFGFNTCICKDACLYLNNPFDAEESLSHLQNISKNIELRNSKIKKGNEIINNLPSNRDIYSMHFEILKQILIR